MLRPALTAFLFLAIMPLPAFAEWQIRPFLGVNFGGGTTLADPESAAGKPKFSYGIAGGLIGEIFGIEVDVARTPGFLETGSQNLVLASSLTTVMGGVTIALPRRISEYTLRPYVVGGAGVMRAQTRDFFGAYDVSDTLAAIDFGGGVTGFLTRRVGINWDVRHFRSVNGKPVPGITLGPEEISFWRAQMALAFRY